MVVRVHSAKLSGMSNEDSPQLQDHGVRWWAARVFAISHMLMFGLGIASVSGELLAQQRPGLISEPWDSALRVLMILCLLWWLFASFPRLPDLTNSPRGIERLEALQLVVGLGVVLLIWQRDQSWSVLCLGPTAATWIAIGYVRKEWPIPFLAALGFCAASLFVFLLSWPNAQRALALFCIGGFATAIQGFVILGQRWNNLFQNAGSGPLQASK